MGELTLNIKKLFIFLLVITDHYFDIIDFMGFHQSSVKVFGFGSSDNFTMFLSCRNLPLTESNINKQTLHHISAVEFGANFQIYPVSFFLKKPLITPTPSTVSGCVGDFITSLPMWTLPCVDKCSKFPIWHLETLLVRLALCMFFPLGRHHRILLQRYILQFSLGYSTRCHVLFQHPSMPIRELTVWCC